MQGHFTKGNTQCPCCIVRPMLAGRAAAGYGRNFMVLPGAASLVLESIWRAQPCASGGDDPPLLSGDERNWYFKCEKLTLYKRQSSADRARCDEKKA